MTDEVFILRLKYHTFINQQLDKSCKKRLIKAILREIEEFRLV